MLFKQFLYCIDSNIRIRTCILYYYFNRRPIALRTELPKCKFDSFQCLTAKTFVITAKRKQTTYGIATVNRLCAEFFYNIFRLHSIIMLREPVYKIRKHHYSIIILLLFSLFKAVQIHKHARGRIISHMFYNEHNICFIKLYDCLLKFRNNCLSFRIF